MKGKSAISAVVSILLCFWYLTAIVGIDVHTDHHDGEVFVVSLLGRTDCESLHPDDVCHCVEHYHGHCHSNDEDCENEISIISLTGDGSFFVLNLAPASTTHLASMTPVQQLPCTEYVKHADNFSDPPRLHLRNLCVLRV